MNIQFLGTGAAEGIPPLFSRNDFTKRVRSMQGPDLRTRSALRIGEEYQVDFGPDTFYQSIRCNCDFYHLRHLMVTHMHADHFYLDGVLSKEMPYDTNGEPLYIYASRPAIEWLQRAVEALFGALQLKDASIYSRYPFVAWDYFEKYSVGELTVHTVRGNHVAMSPEEYSINPLITLPDGRRLLYAVDTGYYHQESWDFLSEHRIDLLIMEATFGGRTDRGERPSGHLDAHSFVRVVERMASMGILSETTQIYATHINPKHPWDHEQLQSFFDSTPFPIRVAYDCLEVSP